MPTAPTTIMTPRNPRDAHVAIVGTQVYLDAHGGVLAGTMIEEIFERFSTPSSTPTGTTASANGVIAWSPPCCNEPRRSDASTHWSQCSPLPPCQASSAGSIRWSTSLSTTHRSNIIWSPSPAATSNRSTRQASTTAAAKPLRGHQLDPADMIAASLTGHIRRVVFDTAGVVIDLGRRSRLFNGSALNTVLKGDR